MLPYPAIWSYRELHLHGVVHGLQALYLDTGRVEENLLSVSQAGTVETDFCFNTALGADGRD
jgi:hypothetical protein